MVVFSHLAFVPPCVFIVESILCRTGGKAVYTLVVMKLGYDLINVLENWSPPKNLSTIQFSPWICVEYRYAFQQLVVIAVLNTL
jgi:hypothetical protein